MGKDTTPTTRSDQSESAVAIAANATVVRKSVRRPRPTPSAALVSALVQKRSAAVCFMGSNPGRRRPAVKTHSWHTYSRTSQNEHFSRSCQLSHFPTIGRRRRGYRCPKRFRPVAITCPRRAACALLVVTGTPNSRPGRRIVGQRKGAQRRSCWTVRAPHLPNLSGAERTPTLYIRPPRAWSRPLRSVASTLVAYAYV